MTGHPRPPLTRRTLLRGGLGLGAGAGAAALAGCTVPGTSSVNTEPTIPPADPDETITLTYWAWLKELQTVADLWNAENPRVQVEISWIPGGNDGGYQKLYNALAAGSGPDLAQVEMRSIPEFMLVNGVVDLSRYGVDEYADRFDPTLWGQVSFAGGIYGIPQDSGPTALYHRPDLLDEVGASPPETWRQWAEIGAEVRDAGRFMGTFPLADTSVFAAHAMQAGAVWLRAEDGGWVIDMAGEATLDVARFFDAAIDDGIVSTQLQPFSPGWFAAAAEGRIATLMSASWGDALLQGVSGAEGKWRVAPLPQWPTGYGSAQLGGSTTAVLANSAHPREAMEFAVWLNSSAAGIDGLIEHSGIGWSANPDHIGAPRQGGSEFFGGQAYNTEVFAPAAEQQNPDWQWWPTTQQTFNVLADAFRGKAGGTSLVDAVVQAEAETMEVFREKGLTIRRAER